MRTTKLLLGILILPWYLMIRGKQALQHNNSRKKEGDMHKACRTPKFKEGDKARLSETGKRTRLAMSIGSQVGTITAIRENDCLICEFHGRFGDPSVQLTSFLDGLNFPSTNLISLDSRQRWYFVERYTNTQTFIFRPHHGLDGPPMPKAFAVMLAARINWVMNEIEDML